MKAPTRSPYFPQSSAGLTRSSYFKSERCNGRAAKERVPETKTKKPVAASTRPTKDKAVSENDGRLTEQESYQGNSASHRANRKIRRARERRRKQKAKKRDRRRRDGSDSGVSAGCKIPPAEPDVAGPNGGAHEIVEDIDNGRELMLRESGGAIVPVATAGDRVLYEAGSREQPLTEKIKMSKKGKKRIRGTRTPVTSILTEVETPCRAPPPSRKRKRSSTIEVVITNHAKSACVRPRDAGLGISHVRNEVREEMAGRHMVKPVRGGAPAGFISQWFPNTEGCVNAHGGGEFPARNISMMGGSEEGAPRELSRNARDSTPYGDTTSIKPRGENMSATTLNCAPPRNTGILLAHAPLGRKPAEPCPDMIEQVSDTVTDTLVKSLPKGARNKIRRTGKVSSYFVSSAVQKAAEAAKEKDKGEKKRVPAGTSIIPWPPLSAETFGLIQEELGSDAYHVIVAAVFLNKTRGAVAVPLLRQFLVDYPSPLALSRGDLQTITAFLQPLGLHRTRANRLVQMGKTWIEQPPTPGMGTTKRNYPASDTQPFDFPRRSVDDGGWPKLGVEKNCIWEIAHLPGVGAYALDSWRIFCLDRFRSGAAITKEEGIGLKEDKGDEWRRVVPKDKELRAYLRWRWAKEGWAEAGDPEFGVDGEARISGRTKSSQDETSEYQPCTEEFHG